MYTSPTVPMSSVEGGIIQRKEVNKYCIVYIRKYKHTVGIFRRAKVSCVFFGDRLDFVCSNSVFR